MAIFDEKSKSQSEIKKVRRRWLLIWHCLICAWTLLYYAPVPNPEVLTIEGYPSENKRCGRSCDTSIIIGEVELGCAVSPLGHAYSCPQFYDSKKKAKVEYFTRDTVFSSIGISSQSSAFLKFEQEGKILKENSYRDLISMYLTGSFLLMVFFVISFISFKKLTFFKEEA